jgi:hypothetical protein
LYSAFAVGIDYPKHYRSHSGFPRRLRLLEMPTPIVLIVSYEGVAGAKLGVGRYRHELDAISAFPSDDLLLLPEALIDEPERLAHRGH